MFCVTGTMQCSCLGRHNDSPSPRRSLPASNGRAARPLVSGSAVTTREQTASCTHARRLPNSRALCPAPERFLEACVDHPAPAQRCAGQRRHLRLPAFP